VELTELNKYSFTIPKYTIPKTTIYDRKTTTTKYFHHEGKNRESFLISLH
jgi:hypothetical protein